MTQVQEAIDIRAPIGDVFAAITDPGRSGEWNPNVVEVRNLSHSPVQNGASWEQVVMFAGKPMTFQCAITSFHPPFEGVLRITGPQQGQIETRCQEVAGATRVIQVIDFVPPGGMLGSLAGGFVRSGLRRELTQSLARLRDALEQETRQRYGSGPG